MGFTNSALATVVMLSPNYSVRTAPIDTITIHCMAGNGSVECCGNIFLRKDRYASSNYGIGSDGRIGLYVEEKNRSWCTSSTYNDNRAVTIEVANDGGAPDWHVSDKALSSLIELVADICKRNKINKLVWSTNKNERVNHLNGCNMTIHRDYAAKACPGDYLYNAHGYIADEVNKRLGVENTMTEQELKKFVEDTVRNMGRGEAPSDWAQSEVDQAKELGITDGSDPRAVATRQEVMIMVKRGVDLK